MPSVPQCQQMAGSPRGSGRGGTGLRRDKLGFVPGLFYVGGMLCATKVRLYPTPEQAEFLGRQFGAVRFVYNRALAVKRHR
jgi:hypothetical protein